MAIFCRISVFYRISAKIPKIRRYDFCNLFARRTKTDIKSKSTTSQHSETAHNIAPMASHFWLSKFKIPSAGNPPPEVAEKAAKSGCNTPA